MSEKVFNLIDMFVKFEDLWPVADSQIMIHYLEDESDKIGKIITGVVFSDKPEGDNIEDHAKGTILEGKKIVSWFPTSRRDQEEYYRLLCEEEDMQKIIDSETDEQYKINKMNIDRLINK